jgi:twitching motility two-component system response regulator PilH
VTSENKMIRVLIVDDHAVVRTGLRKVLESEPDIEVVGEAGDAKNAVFQTRATKPDVILMDVVMPGKNGFQVTSAIARDPETQHIPIIICTSKDQETDRIWGLRQGARDYLVKPIDAQELLSKIAALG